MISLLLKRECFYFSIIFLLLALYYSSHPQEVLTHYHNSEITYLKAKDFANGNHRWGVFFDGENYKTPRYEFHMPEGPTYIMGYWIKLGLPLGYYKIVPIFTSLLAHLFLLISIFHRYGKTISTSLLTLFFSLLAFQPTNIAWAKAVDEGSFDFSLLVICYGLTLWQCKRGMTFFILGLLLGCQEFYRQPMMILSVCLLEFLTSSEKAFFKKILNAFWMGAILGLGILIALLLHVLQIGLAWNDLQAAWDEMAGAVLGRASIENNLNPEFFEAKRQDQINAGLLEENVRAKTLLKIFKSVFWYDHGRHYVIPILFVAAFIYFCRAKSFLNIKIKCILGAWKRSELCVIAFLLALLPSIWTLLMPNHASIHYYYIARDLMGLFWVCLFLSLEIVYRRENSEIS